jgi:predicted CXXCH cytochrome family protein
VRRTTCPVAPVGTLLLAWLVAAAPGASPITGHVQLDFEYGGTPPLLMPTAVTVASDGTVYVADGVNDRVLQFASSGEYVAAITSVGDEALSRPLGLKVDHADNLWIADTGHGRVLVRSPAGELTRTIAVSQASGGRAPDITGVGLAPDGRTVWIVDNDNDLIIRVDSESGGEARFGGPGGALGEFQYPFMCAVGARGDVFVTDVINGRVIMLDDVGQPVRAIGTYGVDLGDLYRPKGIACDRDGNVWVSDGTLGVVQVFSHSGAFLDVLRDADGHPLRLDTPMGLAFDAAGDLYVAELQPNRVRKLRLAVDLKQLRPARPARPPTLASRQPKTCTACHFEWMSPLDVGRGTELADVPPNPPQRPYVSRSEVCRSCHDGSVVDSRRRVWLEHGHRTGITPPADMRVPARLPLADGQIVCRTCHSAHTRGGSGNVFKDVVFLRVANDPAELCTGCHAGFDGGIDAGMHPLGAMPIPVPRELMSDTARLARSAVTCLACHHAHGARASALLVGKPSSDDLCLACHRQLAPELLGDATRSAHGRLPILDPPQCAVAHELGGPVGRDNELLCMTCHASHRARTTHYLLVSPGLQQEACSECHSAQRPVVGTSHDLRTNFPQATNILGLTAQAGGPCSGCHTAHRFARATRGSKLDPTGRCLTCHDRGQLAASKRLGDLNHPGSECTACHNPHQPKPGNYLAGQPADRCRECHAAYAGLTGGPHDLFRNTEAWPAAATAPGDACLACHRPHGNQDAGLFRVAWKQGPQALDAACLACHPGCDPAGAAATAQVHPHDAPSLRDPHGLPVVSVGGRTQIVCQTCHDPHAGSQGAARLLRVAPGADEAQLCLTCHDDKANVRMIGHGVEPLRAAGFEANACQPCHLVHAAPQSVESRIMWPKRLCPQGGPSVPPVALADHYCLSCHREGGPVEPPAIATHPQAEMFNADGPTAPGFLPLFNEQGEVDPRGSIGCRTCHLTHGRATPVPIPPDMPVLTARELRARKWHLRSFAAENVCTTCHGFDALRRFMYFHDPQRRGGPIEETPATDRPMTTTSP